MVLIFFKAKKIDQIWNLDINLILSFITFDIIGILFLSTTHGTSHQQVRVDTPAATARSLLRSLTDSFLCAHAHNSRTSHRWNCEALSSIQRFLYFFS